jgi:hypothetical protein
MMGSLQNEKDNMLLEESIYTSFDTRAMPRVIFFCIKNIKKIKI